MAWCGMDHFIYCHLRLLLPQRARGDRNSAAGGVVIHSIGGLICIWIWLDLYAQGFPRRKRPPSSRFGRYIGRNTESQYPRFELFMIF